MNKGTMLEKRVKTVLQLIGEFLVIWYGMGTPIPTSVTEAIKLVVALLAVTYTGWKNHDFTPEGCVGTAVTRQLKAEHEDGYIGEYFLTNPEEGGDKDEQHDL